MCLFSLFYFFSCFCALNCRSSSSLKLCVFSVSHSHPVLSFTPKYRNTPSSSYPPFHLPTLPPISSSASNGLWSAPAATLERWQAEEGERAERETEKGGEKDMTAPQQVRSVRGGEGEPWVKRRACHSDDELLALGRGGRRRDACGIKRCWSWVKHADSRCSL